MCHYEPNTLRASFSDRINGIYRTFLHPDHPVHPVKKRNFLYYEFRSHIPIGALAAWHRWIIVPLLLIAVTAGCSTLTHVKKNAGDFHEFTLKNGIPVIVKIAEHNRINALALALKGGGSYTPQNLTGIEEMTLALALYESEKFTNIEKRTILKETSDACFRAEWRNPGATLASVVRKQRNVARSG